nr:GTPase ObgE [Saprospiraceae bacterium]
MSTTNFIDHIRIDCKSGSGGPGSVHFRREKYVPRGGPDGGDGGRGGHIILRGNDQLWTLLHLRYKRHIKAEHGESGGGSRSTGADGEDVVIEVPLGTVAKDAETEKMLLEITSHGQEEILLEGGKGGLGNAHFKSPVNQTPRYAQPGIPGKEARILLELKLLADVGLVGFPNAGKSTLLSVLSAAKPKIANYPFTTLTPNLGMVFYRDSRSFVMADIPGIIEGAHAGKGLGLRFLRHIERNSLLLFLVPGDSDQVLVEYRTLLKELEKYSPELLDKPRLLVISKSDLLDEELKNWIEAEIPSDINCHFISSVAHQGLDELKDKIWGLLK